jgi:plasmid stabilization system protein ParE
VTRELEYLEEALQEAEAAARWYAERSVTAAAGFSDEIDAAESAILRLPEAWRTRVGDPDTGNCDGSRARTLRDEELG